jgi:drug/metabolite transporter (DMT)-like permease
MDERNKGLIVFGAILLVIGLIASFYHATWQTDYGPIDKGYPYQNVGILLDVAGIVFIALGLLYSPRKTLPPSNNPPTPSST